MPNRPDPPLIVSDGMLDRLEGAGFLEYRGEDKRGRPIYQTTKAGRREIRRADRRRAVAWVRSILWSTPGDRMLVSVTLALGLACLIIFVLSKKAGI